MIVIVDEVRRTSDGELCGWVDQRGGRWIACTVFGAPLGSHDVRDVAVAHVVEHGLASLTERWVLQPGGGGDTEVVCIQEANAAGVTVALGWYSLPGVPTMAISAAQLAAGEWEMRLLT